ncbi:type I-E CRISPR-associated protein Cas6/Cse3/CasE [Naumannella sp. ID2617S]|nr:type I-E CRISPR-associated protein Cas6/Cse3/CasE [Naumannella sp. ID2617S]
MILTRMHLNPQRRGARKLVSSPQAMHAAVLSGFPPTVDAGRVLWRLDGAAGRHPVLWIGSQFPPDLAHLEEQAGWPSNPTTRSASLDGLLTALSPDQQWAFRITVNPTHRADHGGRKKVLAHVTVDQQTQWLLDRQDRLGCSLVDADGAPTFTLEGRDVKQFRREEGRVTLATATFGGLLSVQDPDRLREVVTQGLGRGKAYGCGLLTLARP